MLPYTTKNTFHFVKKNVHYINFSMNTDSCSVRGNLQSDIRLHLQISIIRKIVLPSIRNFQKFISRELSVVNKKLRQILASHIIIYNLTGSYILYRRKRSPFYLNTWNCTKLKGIHLLEYLFSNCLFSSLFALL